MKNVKKIQFYPLLLVTFPILNLYTHNIEYVEISDIFRILFIALVVVLVALVIIGLFVKDSDKSALYTSLIILLVFSYGHVFTFLQNSWPDIRHRFLLIGWFLILFLGIILINQLKKPPELTKVISLVSIALVVYQIISATSFEINRVILNRENTDRVLDIQDNQSLTNLPDIYFIILDAHSSSAVIKEKFGYDNTPEISKLQELGFYLAECSQSNYTRTEFTLSSTFNMNYLDTYLNDLKQFPDYKSSSVIQFFDNLGYQKIKFETHADHNVSFGEDIYLARDRDIRNTLNVFPFNRMNAYEVQLIQTTWLQPVLTLLANNDDLLPANWVLDVESAKYYDHYFQTLFMLEELPKVPDLDIGGPKFVYAHFLVPHEPYIFHPSGKYEQYSRWDYKIGYANNVEFIDSQLPDLLKKIITRSDTPPIIIVMGDHGRNGSNPEEQLTILNMFYLPDDGDEMLYPKISPVNTFRVILSYYFDTELELLEDISYFGEAEEQGEFSELTVYDNFCDYEDRQD
jgi:hypothetical protein